MQRFTDKIALVTGGTSGIGAATARRLASEGARVAVCGLEAEAGNRMVTELGGEQRALFIHADLTTIEDCYSVIDHTVAVLGGLHVLVNNAASYERATLEFTTPEQFDRLIALNLRAPFFLMQRALPTMQAQYERAGTGGVVINIGSVNANIGAHNLAAYSATKGGLVTLSRNTAAAWAKWRIRVHVLNLGWTLTEGEIAVQRGQGQPDDWAELAGADKPWGRLLKPEEIASAIAYFASDEAQVFSGITTVLEQTPV